MEKRLNIFSETQNEKTRRTKHLTIGMRSTMKSGATVRVLVLEKGPTTATSLDPVSFWWGSLLTWITSFTESSFRASGKLCISEQWSKIS